MSPTSSSAEGPRPFDLASLRLASPCRASWEAMHGDERRRDCAACGLSVYDLCHLTEAEAHALVARHEDARLCVRLHRRADGTVITRDCPVGVGARVKRRRWIVFVTLALLPWVARWWPAVQARLVRLSPWSGARATPGDDRVDIGLLVK